MTINEIALPKELVYDRAGKGQSEIIDVPKLTLDVTVLYETVNSIKSEHYKIKNKKKVLLNLSPLQNPSYKEIKIMDNTINQFVTNYRFCCFGGFAKDSNC